ncbi:MAG: DNA (cytosine-5-)-methyltransferase [Bryobacteraceae bacterium]
MNGCTVAGLFAGIGGLECGLERAGHRTALMVEVDTAANAVLAARFPGIAKTNDVRELDALPRGVDMLAAGFPCQDLSQAGRTTGIRGSRSGLVDEVFRLARRARVDWILLENVPFMLQLHRGEAMRHIVGELETMGYAWAYRKIDTRAFGLPQRRERVFLLASRVEDPAGMLFAEEADAPVAERRGAACGFYWTEGTRGLGWAVDAVPTLKGGSAIGIPSPPAIWMPDGRICTPDLRDAERLQGFDAGWTEPAAEVVRASYRWKLVGNAVSVPAAEWMGQVLRRAPGRSPRGAGELAPGRWPDAAYGGKGVRRSVECSAWPVARQRVGLAEFLEYPVKPLSERATRGFYERLTRGPLRYEPEFRRALERHLEEVQQPVMKN